MKKKLENWHCHPATRANNDLKHIQQTCQTFVLKKEEKNVPLYFVL